MLCLKKIASGTLETIFEVKNLVDAGGDPSTCRCLFDVVCFLFRLCAGIHHLNWIESDLIVVGYLKEADEFQASLCLVRINVTAKTASVVHDAKDAVCSPEKTDLCSHHYTTCYLPQWYAMNSSF